MSNAHAATVKRYPVYQDADGRLFEKIKQTDAIRDPRAIRELVTTKDGELEVRWLVPLGTVNGSKAFRDESDHYVASMSVPMTDKKQPAK